MNDLDSDIPDVPWTKIVLWCCAIGVAAFFLNAMGWVSFDFWAPKYENTRRTVFEESASHVHGKRQYLTRLWGEWKQADPSHRLTICAVARHEASTLNPEHLPESIRNWECVK